MKFELTYKNRFGSVARLDIITFADTTVTEVIEGTEQPFTLKYSNEKGDKSGNFRTSGADINIYETANFNIDELKTSNETDIKVEYYIDEVLMWVGFVIPDFFSREIGVPAIVNMTASDRLNTLKGATLPSTSDTVTLRYLAEQCLAMTGLSLPLNTYANFTNVDNSDNIFDSKVTSQRVKDTKGRSISCYDVLQSILTLTNSILIQRSGEWYIINKTELETGTVVAGQAEVVFDEVSRGARRQIQPVASSVGVFNEHGGSRLYPYNYDFEQELTGWTAVGGFAATTNNKSVSWYLESNGVYTPVYETASDDRYLVNTNELSGAKYLQSDFVRIPYSQGGEVEVNFDINATLPAIKYFSSTEAAVIRFVIVARKNGVLYYLNESGLFDIAIYMQELTGAKAILTTADTKAKSVKGKIISDNLNDYEISVRIYGSGTYATTLIRSAVFGFKYNAEFPKGNIYKTEQGVNFTKQQDIDTSIFGDYITSGVNGYFYDYPIDDTSSLLTSTGVLTTRWTTVADADELPILQHVSRQKSRLFSVAHDLLRAQISIQKFDPLAIFKDCANKKYTLVSASVDFLNSSVDVEIEEIKTDTLISKRDFIYSYFGDKEDGIKSVGGISTGSGGGVGGGMTSGQLEILTNLASWWKYDETNNAIYSPLSVYSEGEVSAYGAGAEGTPTEGVLYMNDLLDVQFATTVPANDTIKFNGTKWVNVPFPTGISSWNDLTDKPLTFAPTAHNHSASEIISGIFAIGRIPTGTTETTVALGNHVHSWSAIANKPSVFTPDTHVHQWGDIQNKPSLFAPDTHYHYVADILNFPTSMPASDVYAWAKASTKPTYVWSEIGSKPSVITNTTASFTTALETKLNGIATGAQVNVNADWNATSGDALILNKPTTFSGTFYGNLIGNATSATGLQYARTIWGQAFDGNSNVSGTLDLGSGDLTWGGWGAGKATLAGVPNGVMIYPKGNAYTGEVYINGNLIYHTGNFTNLNQLTTRNFSDLQNKPTTIGGYGITDAYTKSQVDSSVNTKVSKSGDTMTGNLTMGVTTDIITNFKTWTKDSSKSLKSFLDKFDIDANGNLVVLGNLYSTGEVTAYSSGTGVSGLKLMGDMDANTNSIVNLASITNSQSTISLTPGGIGFHVFGSSIVTITDDGLYSSVGIEASALTSSAGVYGTSFNFGNYSFKQSANGLSICFNGVEQAYITNTGQYVNS